jgi:mannose-6-phosphate isomerase-like protein (cupin superfamily)
MQVVPHPDLAWEIWRPGVETRMLVSALTGATELCLFEQKVASGMGAPTHRHSVEEVLTIIAGEAEAWVGEERVAVVAGQSVIVPAGLAHGFHNTGTGLLHVQALLASPSFEASFDGVAEPVRRWLASP